MIVAVRDFNFGAMENKGLNIFNSSLLLADPATATDVDYERIEGVIAHEYFHNWTGDRVTCRDWFQLCLKEGLTVFRDQSFSADQRGHAVQRIKDVQGAARAAVPRGRRPPRPPGAAVELHQDRQLLHRDHLREGRGSHPHAEDLDRRRTLSAAGMDLYFERWDGQATTVEAFIQCFADVSGQDLDAFFAWYEQAGTPRVSIAQHYDEANQTLDLLIDQEVPPTPGQPTSARLPIPIAIGLLDEDGRPLSFRAPGAEEATLETVIVVDRPHTAVRLEGVASRPVLSALRGFSAPVSLSTDAAAKDRYVLLAADPDLFNRWEAGQQLARDLILARAAGAPDEVGEERFADRHGPRAGRPVGRAGVQGAGC